MLRILAAVMGAALTLNGLAMLGAPTWWFGVVPGVASTGAFNPHFVRDIGAAYLVVSLGLVWFAVRPRAGWAALVASATFLGLHALIHLRDAALSLTCGRDLMRDAPSVLAPALLAIVIAVLSRPTERSPS